MKAKNIIIDITIVISLVLLVTIFNLIDNREITVKEEDKPMDPVVIVEEDPEPIVYEGMTMDELAEKLDRSLHSDLAGSGYYFAKYSIQYGVDPYLATAISLHETGCNAKCSAFVVRCNNVGGMKFRPNCYAGTSYGRYDTLEQGIEGFIRNIANNYYAFGLTTAEAMAAKYEGTGSKTWAPTVNRYIQSIKNS